MRPLWPHAHLCLPGALGPGHSPQEKARRDSGPGIFKGWPQSLLDFGQAAVFYVTTDEYSKCRCCVYGVFTVGIRGAYLCVVPILS